MPCEQAAVMQSAINGHISNDVAYGGNTSQKV